MASSSEISTPVDPIENFFKNTNGRIKAQLLLFESLISTSTLGEGVLAITAHDEEVCDIDDCLIGTPCVQYLDRQSYMSELFEDRWWSDHGASVIFCKHAEDVSCISTTLGTIEGQAVITFSALLFGETISEKVWCYIVENTNTCALEYHFADETSVVDDNHPVFITYQGLFSVEPIIKKTCTVFSAKHFASEFGDQPTHIIKKNRFIKINPN